MSPEQATAEGQIDQRADIYALGAVAYELLTGRPPFVGASPQQVLAAHVTQAPEHVTQRRATCPPALASMVMRCLEKRPADRWQHAEEIAHQLDVILTPSGGHAPTTATAGYSAPMRKWLPLAMVGLVVALGGAGFVLWPRGTGPAAPTIATNRRVAVLPFENLGDSSHQYFANGVTEAITSQLTSIGDLSVIPRATAAKYRGSPKSVSEIAGELGVGYVLTGTVQWDETPGREPRVRVSPELIRISDTSSVWAHGYDAVITSVFDVYSDVSNQVAGALAVALNDPQKAALARRPTDNAEAYDLYLRAVDFANRGLAAQNLEMGIPMLERAVTLDPKFALAWGRMAEMLGLAHWLYVRHTDETLVQAQAAAEKALELQPDLPEAHRAMGQVWYRKREYDKALAEYAIVERSQPNSADLISSIGFVERRQAKWTEAAAHLSRAVDLDPGSAQALSQLGETYSIMRQYDRGFELFRRGIAIAPDQPDSYYFLAMGMVAQSGDTAGAHRVLRQGLKRIPPVTLVGGTFRPMGWLLASDDTVAQAFLTSYSPERGAEPWASYTLRGEIRFYRGDTVRARALYDSARVVLEQLVAKMPDDYGFQTRLGWVYARLGQGDKAIRAAKRAVTLLPPERDDYFGNDNIHALARVYAVLGQAGPAVEQLKRAENGRGYVTAAMLRVEPVWDPIRSDPAFQAWMNGGH